MSEARSKQRTTEEVGGPRGGGPSLYAPNCLPLISGPPKIYIFGGPILRGPPKSLRALFLQLLGPKKKKGPPKGFLPKKGKKTPVSPHLRVMGPPKTLREELQRDSRKENPRESCGPSPQKGNPPQGYQPILRERHWKIQIEEFFEGGIQQPEKETC